MQILSVRVLEGPNIYSLHPVLKVKLDLEAYSDVASSELAGFVERLTALLPGLAEHGCCYGHPGGFIKRLREGTYLAHIFEHVTLELQCLAGHEVRFGKARSTDVAGVYDVIVGYRVPVAAIQAVYTAEKLLKSILEELPFSLEEALRFIRKAVADDELGPSTGAIYNAALARGIPVRRLANENLLYLGYGHKQKKVWTTVTSRTSLLASDLACDKNLTKQILADNGIPVPYGLVVNSAQAAADALTSIGGTVAIKPLHGNQGKGVTLHITTRAQAERAYQLAVEFDAQVVVEQFVTGQQYRLCVVNGKMVAAAERIPAYVTGDGHHTVKELIEIVNRDPQRGEGHEKPLTKIIMDALAITVLARQGFNPQSIPPAGHITYIRENANLSTGGTAVDVTDVVHPDNICLAERAARLIGLDVAGIDIVTPDITKPMTFGSGAIIEVNAAPGIRMHHYPAAGKSRDVAGAIVDSLFPEGDQGRIPIVAITGTNGKTTVTRMIGHIWQNAGYKVGMTTTDGIFINGRCVEPGDTTGPSSARIVLGDSTVEVAVLETARGGIMRGGLAFDACDVGIITNITEDHLGQDGIEDLEDLAYVKSLIVETVKPSGVALLNADDRYVVSIARRVRSEVVYFSTQANNMIVRRHLGAGGRAVFIKGGTIYAANGSEARPVTRVRNIPATLNGVAQHNAQNAVIAAAACYGMNVPVAAIRRGLSTFEQNPGRLTMLSLEDFRVCVDYGHNPAGYQALIATARRLKASRLVGVIAAPGDRRDDVILNVGRIAGRGFDFLYIKEDDDLRGRQSGEVAELLRQGALESGISPNKIVTILPEAEAVSCALQGARAGDLIVVFYEKYDSVLDVIHKYHELRLSEEADAGAGEPMTAAGPAAVGLTAL